MKPKPPRLTCFTCGACLQCDSWVQHIECDQHPDAGELVFSNIHVDARSLRLPRHKYSVSPVCQFAGRA